MRFSYTGDRVPKYWPTPLFEGFTDGLRRATVNEPNLYNWGIYNRIMWFLGRAAARFKK